MSQQFNDYQTVNPKSRADVVTAVCAELAKLGPLSNCQIRPDSDLASELNVDSLDAITLVLALNSRFGIDLPNTTLDALRTPERIADVVLSLTEAKSRLSAMTQEIP